MSGAVTAIAAVSAAYSIYSGERAAHAQRDAQNQALADANRQAAAADQAQNRANQKHPDTSAILSAAGQAGRAGESGTMLTGPAGVDASTLNLGKNTLLGQ
jgi:hypothetical protein